MSKDIHIVKYKIRTEKPTAPLRIVLISDIHERVPEKAAEIIRGLFPDIIAVAGDTLERYCPEVQKEFEKTYFSVVKKILFPVAFYFNLGAQKVFCRKNRPSNRKTCEFLTEISRIAPVFMSTGNHEQRFRNEDYNLFQGAGITLLENRDVSVTVKGQRLLIGGLSTFYDEEWLGSFAAKKGFKILLCHHPSYYDRLSLGDKADLVLAGHNHGGQIRLFGKGLLSSGEGFFPKYDRGAFDNRMIVSAGCSNTVALPRINNPREIVCIDLVSKV